MKIQASNTRVEIDGNLISEPGDEIRSQVQKYLKGGREAFDLSISFPDSFTGEVMREMQKIPYGETWTYRDKAEALDSSDIAVGQACGRNPVPIIVPCHRVVGKDSLGGYYLGLELKERLLYHESADF